MKAEGGLGDRESFGLETQESVGVRFHGSEYISSTAPPSPLIALDQLLVRVSYRNRCGW